MFNCRPQNVSFYLAILTPFYCIFCLFIGLFGTAISAFFYFHQHDKVFYDDLLIFSCFLSGVLYIFGCLVGLYCYRELKIRQQNRYLIKLTNEELDFDG